MTYTLEELDALCDVATDGPWFGNHDGKIWHRDHRHRDVKFCLWYGLVDDVDLITTARTALPELIARVRELEDLLGRAVCCLGDECAWPEECGKGETRCFPCEADEALK